MVFSLEEEPQAVPAASEYSRDSHFFQGYHREFAIRIAFELDAHHADLLPGRDRREQRLLGFYRRLELVAVTPGHAQEKVVRKTRLDLVRAPFPDFHRRYGLVLVVELDRVVE